jgi:hypothetical protein
MGITAVWDNDEKTIIRYIYDGSWTWDDFYTAFGQAYKMIDTVNHRVDIIVDVRMSSLLPQNALSRGRQLSTSTHTNQGRTIVVGANALMRSVSNIFNKVYTKAADDLKISFVRTMEEAHDQLLHRIAVEK